MQGCNDMDYTPEFIKLWQAYPGRYHDAGRPKAGGGYEYYWKIGKRKAMEEWSKLTDYQKQWVMYAVRFMKRGKYVPDLHRWLKDGKYEDVDLPKEKHETIPAKFLPKMKTVSGCVVNINDERNKQMAKLKKPALKGK